MNGLTLLALIAAVVGGFIAYRAGALHARREHRHAPSSPRPPPAPADSPATIEPAFVAHDSALDDERMRLVRSYEAEAARLRDAIAALDARTGRLESFAEDRARMFVTLATLREDVARYRGIVVDIENNAPPPLLESPTAPDDLKLIVGIGPVLERMLQQLGIATYRQIARWSERDIDDFDARLAEFPGRIRRDDWVTQARALHQSKYGESAVPKERI